MLEERLDSVGTSEHVPGCGCPLLGGCEYLRGRRQVETIREEFHRGNDREVIRVGEALSRPLFESGAFSVRLDIGRMVEEAAARSERRRVQYVALIDEIGWSLVELGRYGEATRQIQHGMRILESSPDVFYEATAHRHLGVIARRERRYDAAREHNAHAEELASGLEASHDRLAMVAGLQYAQASLSYYQADFPRAAAEIDDAIASFHRPERRVSTKHGTCSPR